MVNEWTALADRLERQAATISELQGDFLRVERDAARWRRAHEIVEQERDQARAERDAAYRHRDEWRERAEAAEARYRDIAKALVEWHGRWVDMERERDEALEASALFQRDVHAWRARAEAAEARTAPAVTRDEVWRVVAAHDPGDDEMALCRVNRLTDAVCHLVFGVEAEPADPVTEKARELHEVAQGDGPFIVWEALMDPERNRYLRMAAHVLGQGDRHVDQ